ncbi:hypothetical protein DV738_g2257, partial [Chaetothyriales sp. CBS 135597]
MRSTSRLLATVKAAAKYLEPNTPTGLTGLLTHPAPRTALLYNYHTTLSKLAKLPESSVYRKSTEALTKHRLKIVEETVPEGFDAYLERVQKQIDAHPEAYGKLKGEDGSFSYSALIVTRPEPWDGKTTRKDAFTEGSNTQATAEKKVELYKEELEVVAKVVKEGETPTVDDLETEPPLTAEQINSIENKIGAGLIEEVIQVAEGELLLVDQMIEAEPWLPLEEQSPPGQWSYFERGERV